MCSTPLGIGHFKGPRRDAKLDEKNKRRERQNDEDYPDEAGPRTDNDGMGRTAGLHGKLLDKGRTGVLTPDYIS